MIWSLEVGIDTKQTIILHEKNEYIPATTSLLDVSLFVRHSFYGKWNYFAVAPAVKIHNDTLRFGFYELDVSFFSNNISLSLGKTNFYFGDGISKNILFPAIPLSIGQISRQKLWNQRFNIIIDNFSLSQGYIADTESIDDYNIPGWHSIYTTLDYSWRLFNLTLEGDVFFNENDNITGKTAFAFKMLLPGDFTIYNTIAYKYKDALLFKDSFSVITGFSKYYTLHPFAFTSIIEPSYDEGIINLAFYQSIEYESLVLIPGISVLRDLNSEKNSLKPEMTLDWYMGNLNFEMSYNCGDLLSEDIFSGSVLFIGVNYVFN
jgi:hypothetical protein